MSDSCAVDDIVLCLSNFPDALFRRYDILVSISSLFD